MSGGDYGRSSDSVRGGLGVNDYKIKELKLIKQCLYELRMIRAHLECITQEEIKFEDLENDYK